MYKFRNKTQTDGFSRRKLLQASLLAPLASVSIAGCSNRGTNSGSAGQPEAVSLHGMVLNDIETDLMKEIEQFEIIDAHEHIPPEADRLKENVNLFTLFTMYTHGDLLRAGMDEKNYQKLYDESISLEKRWRMLKPYWQQIRMGSYARAILLAIKKFYGFDDITDKTYEPLSQAITAANKPGVYKRVLGNACKIRTCLTQCGKTKLGTDLLTPVIWLEKLWYRGSMNKWSTIEHPLVNPDATVKTLDEFIEVRERYFQRVVSEGAVALKMMCQPFEEPNRKDALKAFNQLRNGKIKVLPTINPLRDYAIDRAIAFAEKNDLPVAVHTGVWKDFRELDPLHMIGIIQRFPKVKFDVYHLGYPYVRECLMLGKGFANVWINFCWSQIISQRCSLDALDEVIDLLPANKVIAFGGDYRWPIEKVYGHLVMARENIVRVLARRIERKEMTMAHALEIAHKWLFDNANELYKLNL